MMEQYTAHLESMALEALDDDNLHEKLLEVAQSFHTFAVALGEFITAHGYRGDMEDASAKAAIIQNAFERERVTPVPRNVKKWFVGHREIERRTVFQICFAFRLNIKETDDFFRRIYLERSFDYHSMEEAVYYFCIKNGLDYPEALRIIREAPIQEIPDVTKSRIDFDSSVLFTAAIKKEIDKFSDTEELLLYFRKNVLKFGYNHAQATRMIQKLWNDIAKKGGLADTEKKFLQPAMEEDEEARPVFPVYLQMLGLDDAEEIAVTVKNGKKEVITKKLFTIRADRSIKPILKNNLLLPSVAERSFPNRLTIEKIVRGDHVEHESIRKTLILLKFYVFWCTKIFKSERKTAPYMAEAGDTQRCILGINKLLLEAGYPELYYGNPYDWIFFYSSESEEPLNVFREFIRELYLEKEEVCKSGVALE